MKQPVISLLTDFGSADHYVAAMKGVILAICPAVRLVDISHETTPHEVTEAAYTIAQAWQWFPKGTVHLVVVDPGVGSARRPILAYAGGHYFVAPDNGVLSMVFSAVEPKVRAITADRYFNKPVSQTFHGRDIFAPVAAHLAGGLPAAKFGKLIGDYVRLACERPVRTARRGWSGTILKIDRFGNIITNFDWETFRIIEDQAFDMQVGLTHISRLAGNYSEMSFGEAFLIRGSAGYIEVSMNQGHAAKTLGVAVGAPVELKLL